MALTDDQLQDQMQQALEPLYKAHMSEPDQTSLVVTVSSSPRPGEVYGELTVASVDFQGLDTATKASFSRTFNTLARTLDPKPNRRATGLDYVDGG